MAVKLFIAGVDRFRDYERGTMQIEAALTYQIDTCRFQVRGEQPTEGQEVIIEDTSIGRLFGGIIVRVELAKMQPDKSNVLWQVECDDYTVLLDRRLVIESYEDIPADLIFRDIVTRYCPGFTVKGVRWGAPIIESTGAEFEYKRPSECFRWLCDYTGWHWQPDYYKDLQFFSLAHMTDDAPMELKDGRKYRLGKYSIDSQGLRNRVYVRGGVMPSDIQVVEWKADGVARVWALPWTPYVTRDENGKIDVTIEVDEVAQVVGMDGTDADTDYYYMINVSEKYIRATHKATTPAAGKTISFRAKQTLNVITMVEDEESQRLLAAAQGSDGVYEHVIYDDSLITLEAAEVAGMADLKLHANPRVKGDFETWVSGWKPGQLVTIHFNEKIVVRGG